MHTCCVRAIGILVVSGQYAYLLCQGNRHTCCVSCTIMITSHVPFNKFNAGLITNIFNRYIFV